MMFRESRDDFSDRDSDEEHGEIQLKRVCDSKNKLNVWSEVIYDQMLSSELGSNCGVGKEMVKRSVESYDLPPSRKDEEVIDGERSREKRARVHERLGKRKDEEIDENKSGGSLVERLGEKIDDISEEKDLRRKLCRKERFNIVLKLNEEITKELLLTEDKVHLVDGLMEVLHEPASMRDVFERVVEEVGIEGSKRLLNETQEVQAKGGMFTLDESRKRSAGGVFLHLLKSVADKQQQLRIFNKQLAPRRRRRYHYNAKDAASKSNKNKNNNKNNNNKVMEIEGGVSCDTYPTTLCDSLPNDGIANKTASEFQHDTSNGFSKPSLEDYSWDASPILEKNPQSSNEEQEGTHSENKDKICESEEVEDGEVTDAMDEV